MREGLQQAFGIWNPTIWTRLDLFDLCAVLPPPSKKQQLRHKHHLHFTSIIIISIPKTTWLGSSAIKMGAHPSNSVATFIKFSMPGVVLVGGRALLFAVFLQLSIFVLSRGIEGGQLLVDQSEWPLKALASLPPLLLQLTHYYHHCLLNINACKERLWPENGWIFGKRKGGRGHSYPKKFVADFRISRKKRNIAHIVPIFCLSHCNALEHQPEWALSWVLLPSWVITLCSLSFWTLLLLLSTSPR